MTNITYGRITSNSNNNITTTGGGTDLIATLDSGKIIAYSPGDIAWVLACSALVWLMIPGVGFLYSGLVRGKNALSLLLLAFLSMAVVSVQWWFWGYSLAFSSSSGLLLGNLKHIIFRGVLEQPEPAANNKIPRIVFALYQNMFAALVPAVAIGAAAERGRIGPSMIFVFAWATVVYCPLVSWIWNPNGWAFKWGVLDYAGGVPIEICSGATGLSYSIFLGRRRGFGTHILNFKPHNTSHIVLGTALLWAGWLGFNGGSAYAANIKAALAICVTNLAGSVGGIVWMLIDFRLERKWSCVGLATGSLCGLVAITPAGFVGMPAAALIGGLAAAISNLLTAFKHLFNFDDAMDIFACHAVSGAVGLILTGIFGSKSRASSDGFSNIGGGWVDHNWKQLYKQLAWVIAGFAWSFIMTYILMYFINLLPHFQFRIDEEGEVVGTDVDQCGEKV
ncbi:uncharacterized protein MELLADRAFT_24225, partial [Melampsora larici-populina 98AG31]